MVRRLNRARRSNDMVEHQAHGDEEERTERAILRAIIEFRHAQKAVTAEIKRIDDAAQ